MSVNLLTHGIAILELAPQEPGGYLCTDSVSTYACSPEDFCGVEGITYEVNYAADSENIYNWYTKLDLVCKPKSAMRNIGVVCMIGIFLSVMFVPRLGDLFGRKPVVYASIIGSVAPLLLVVFTTKVWVVTVGAFFAGPCIIARMSCGFLLLMEQVPTKQQAAVGAVIMVSEGLCQVLWVVFLTAFSKNTFYFMYFAIALNLFAVVTFYWVPESPRYLYGINDLEKCAEVLTYIAKMNGVKDYVPPKFNVEYEIDIGIEDMDSSMNLRVSEPDKSKNFDSLISKRGADTSGAGNDSKQEESHENRQTTAFGRYMTVAKGGQRAGSDLSINGGLTKRESVALMHATVTGIRNVPTWWVVGAARTQSIAIDEAFSKNRGTAFDRKTVTLRMSDKA